MKKLVVEKEVPIPFINTKYPFLEMEVGDSFFIALKDSKFKTIRILQANVMAQAHRWAKEGNEGIRFITRKNHQNDGMRCWRIK